MSRQKKQVRYQVKVTIEADTKTETLFFRKLAKEMVEQLMGKPKGEAKEEPKEKSSLQKKKRHAKKSPKGFTLEKPPSTKPGRVDYSKGPIVYRSKDVNFSIKANRVRETKALISKKAREAEVSRRKAATMLTFNYFRKNGCGLLLDKLGNSPYRAVVEAVPEFKMKPWEMLQSPRKFWKVRQNRATATQWLLEKTGKGPQQVTTQDFRDYGIDSMLHAENGKSVYMVLVDARRAHSPRQITMHSKAGVFAADKVYPWELTQLPPRYFNSECNRVAAARWLVFVSKKDPKDISYEDFIAAGLQNLVLKYGGNYSMNKRDGNTRYRSALREAGFDV